MRRKGKGETDDPKNLKVAGSNGGAFIGKY